MSSGMGWGVAGAVEAWRRDFSGTVVGGWARRVCVGREGGAGWVGCLLLLSHGRIAVLKADLECRESRESRDVDVRDWRRTVWELMCVAIVGLRLSRRVMSMGGERRREVVVVKKIGAGLSGHGLRSFGHVN